MLIHLVMIDSDAERRELTGFAGSKVVQYKNALIRAQLQTPQSSFRLHPRDALIDGVLWVRRGPALAVVGHAAQSPQRTMEDPRAEDYGGKVRLLVTSRSPHGPQTVIHVPVDPVVTRRSVLWGRR